MTRKATRDAELKRMLTERRRQAQDELQSRVRDGRSSRATDVRDELEHSDAHVQEDIEMALLQMRAETLARIDQALVRLDAGTYGRCAECKTQIPGPRLRALPLALRCQPCQQARENVQQAPALARRGGTTSLFPDAISS